MSESGKKKFFLFRWIDHACYAGGLIAALCLAALPCIIVLEIVLRKFFNSPTTWVGETSIYLFMALGFLSLGYALQTDNHFSITAVTDLLTKKNRLRLKIFTDIFCLFYSATFVYKGIGMAWFAYEIGDISTGMMAMPLWITNSLVPIGGLLLALQFINKLVEDFQNLKNE